MMQDEFNDETREPTQQYNSKGREDNLEYGRPAMPTRKKGGGWKTFGIVILSIFMFLVIVCGGGAWWLYSKVDDLANMGIAIVLDEMETEINISNLPQDQKDALLIVTKDMSDAFDKKKIQVGIDFETGIKLKSDPKVAIDLATNTLKSATDKLDLPAEEKTGIKTQLDRLNQEANAGNINQKDIERALQNLQGSPLLHVSLAYYFEKAYVQPSGFSEPEKLDALIQVQRFILSNSDATDPPAHMMSADKPYIMQKTDPDTGETENVLKPKLTDEELRVLVEDLKKENDKNGAPATPDFPTFSEGFEKFVDDMVGA